MKEGCSCLCPEMTEQAEEGLAFASFHPRTGTSGLPHHLSILLLPLFPPADRLHANPGTQDLRSLQSSGERIENSFPPDLVTNLGEDFHGLIPVMCPTMWWDCGVVKWAATPDIHVP